MTKIIRMSLAPLAIIALAGACNKSNDAAPASRQVELAPSPAAQPQLADTAAPAPAPEVKTAPEAKPAPKKPAPKPETEKPAPVARPSAASAPAPAAAPEAPAILAAAGTGTIASGSSLGVVTGTRICTNTHKPGDRVMASVSAVARGTNGVSVPTGATFTLRVTESVRGNNGKEGIRLAFAPVSVTIADETYAVAGTASVGELEKVAAQTAGDQAKKVATGAVVGAIAGKLLGRKNKDAVIGAAVGAAAGGAIAAGTTDWNGCLPQGGRVNVTLSAPLTIKRQ